VLLPRQQAKLARGTKDKEHAMSQTPNTAIAVIGIDIGKNSFHVVGHDARRVVLTAHPSLPVHPDKRTISEPVGMSQTCHD
jgi:hypothetical protein